ncbi:hypothetical protein [Jeotgalibacillus sp. JSM ZJ347]|uniref:hypothetical protein n=1 Tax=Jeotgalibacillus sp. JSM ZJ347 TaxID=3342117 RepID=UPI0035A84099
MSKDKHSKNQSGINKFSILPILIIITLACNLFFLIYLANSARTMEHVLQEDITTLQKEISLLQEENELQSEGGSEATVNLLREEFSNYKDMANSNTDSFISLVNTFFVALGILVTAGVIVLYWIFGQTKSEVKENAEVTLKSSVEEIKSDVKNEILKLSGEAVKDLEGKYTELERFMNAQYSIRQSRVLFITPEDKKEEMDMLEIERVRKLVKSVETLIVEEYDDFETRMDTGDVDILVYAYKQSIENGDPFLGKYIDYLRNKDSKVPIVIYAKSDRVTKNDEIMIHDYPFSVLANLPTTLTSNMISLTNILSYNDGGE